MPATNTALEAKISSSMLQRRASSGASGLNAPKHSTGSVVSNPACALVRSRLRWISWSSGAAAMMGARNPTAPRRMATATIERYRLCALGDAARDAEEQVAEGSDNQQHDDEIAEATERRNVVAANRHGRARQPEVEALERVRCAAVPVVDVGDDFIRLPRSLGDHLPDAA